MALLSPGVEVTIIDESQYIPAATNSVPYVLVATAQNKVSGAGVGVAAGTLKANANKTYLITSQRDLSATFGVPFFYKTTAGTPINGYELNEYGLLAAYSALGVSNRCYVQRADIDLAELTATLVRPTGAPDNGTTWLDTASTNWGIFEWNQLTAAFTNKIPLVITDETNLEPSTTVPLQSIGAIGTYAITATSTINPGYYKRGGPTADETSAPELYELYNTWVRVGTDEWKLAWPTIQGTNAPANLTAANSIFVNDTEVAVPASPNNTVEGLSNAINSASITGVYSSFENGRLNIYADSTATNDGSTEGGIGIVSIANGTGTPLAALGITSGEYLAPTYLLAPTYQAPRWRSSDTMPEPTGSVWQKQNAVNLGTSVSLKVYDSVLGSFVSKPCPLYLNTPQAIYALDPSGGGINIPANTYIAKQDFFRYLGFEILRTGGSGVLNVTGTTVPNAFIPGNSYRFRDSSAGSPNYGAFKTVTLTGSTPQEFVTDFLAQASPHLSCSINSQGNIVFTQLEGGAIEFEELVGNPLGTAGFTSATPFVREAVTPTNTFLILSWFQGAPDFTYTASNTAPDQDPADGRLWYYSATDQADIMIQNNGAWVGYQTVTNDVRGYDLSLTNAAGPIFSSTPPITQNDGDETILAYGTLWIDTSDLENYPALYRWQNVDFVDQWVAIDKTDQTTENGILFEDARWATNGTTNPITDPLPSIQDLLTSDYVDLDAPDPSLYPQGMLLWNTRRSGFNVKRFAVNYFNGTNFDIAGYSSIFSYVVNDFVLYEGTVYVCIANAAAGITPNNTAYWAAIQTNAWVNAAGNKADGSPYMGRQSQRALIVAALKAGIDSSTTAREEQVQFNLVACPQYPELTTNLIALNNERDNTGFVIADTPLRLTPDEIVTFATNNNGLGISTGDALNTANAYCGAFYPSCQTTDLSGSPVIQPPSHMMLRTIIRSDEVAYPWLAPAGTRRGVIDNATQIGYIQAETGEFVSLGVNQALRDVLYENRINPITFVPGIGITNFGNKTVTDLDSALNRINVARLVAFIRGRLEVIAKQFLFEPNDQITRNEITNSITSLMVDLVAKRGIYDYLVVCDLTNNTPARIDRNELYVDIAIEPVKAVEFIYIPVRIKNTGEIASQSV